MKNFGQFSRWLLENRYFWVAVTAAMFLANAVWFSHNRVNGDVAWYLYAVDRIWDGAVLYRDLHDINLPIVYLLYLPLAAIHKLSGIPAHIAMLAVIWSVVCLLLFLTARVTALTKAGRNLMFFAIAFAALSMNQTHLGQRDPICGLLFAGLVISGYLSLEQPAAGASTLCWIGTALASLCLAMKPYFLAPWVLIVLSMAWQVGIWKTARMKEFWLPLAVSVASWICTLTLFPDYLTMATVASHYYQRLNGDAWKYFPLILPLGVALIALLYKPRTGLRTLIRFSALAMAGFAFESILQAKGSPYHMAPAIFWSALTIGLLTSDRIEGDWNSPGAWKTASGAVIATFALVTISISAMTDPPVRETTSVDRIVQQHGRGRVVLTLSTYPWTSFPLIYEAGATNARPDASQWPLGGMYSDQVERASQSPQPTVARYHRRTEMSEDERHSFDEVVHIMTTTHPDFILVQIGPRKWGFEPLEFSFVDYYSTDPEFKGALEFYQNGPSDEGRLLLVRKDVEFANWRSASGSVYQDAPQ